MNINILHEDNHLLIVEKPVNLPVQKDRSKDKDLLTILKEDIKLRYNKPGNVFLAIVHRLDRPVGGAIVFSKTSKGASRLANELRKRKLKRSYLAIVRGQVQQREGQLVDYLYKDRRRNIVHVIDKNKKGCQKAILNYHVIDYFKNEFTLLYVTLQTGRSHQIRVQLAHMGYPLYGDQK